MVLALLASSGLVGWPVVRWNDQVFDLTQSTDGAETAFPDLPSPHPSLPLGFGLQFLALVPVVGGLCVPRDKVHDRLPAKRG